MVSRLVESSTMKDRLGETKKNSASTAESRVAAMPPAIPPVHEARNTAG